MFPGRRARRGLLIVTALLATMVAGSAHPCTAGEPGGGGAPASRLGPDDGERPPWGRQITGGDRPEIEWGRVLLGLAVIAGLVLGGATLLRRLNGGLPLGGGRYLQVLEAKSVGGKVSLFLVRIGERVVLLAANGDNVTRVCDFGADELPEFEPDARPARDAGFAGLLKRLAGARS